MVKLYASKGDLEILVPEGLTTNAINAYEVHFSFADDWDGFSRTAVFYQTQRGKRYSIVLADDTAYIPAEMLQVNLPVYVGMVGQKGDVKKTTKFVKLEIEEGADSKGTVTFVQTVDDKIAFIRLNHGIFEYSTDGNEWAQMKAEAPEPTKLFIDNKAVPTESYGITLETDETLNYDYQEKKLGLSAETKAKFTGYTEKTDNEIAALQERATAVDEHMTEVDREIVDLDLNVQAAADGIKKATASAKTANEKADKNATDISKNATDIATLDKNKFDKKGGAISGDVSIGGNLRVEGTTTTEHASQLFVDKPIIAVNGKKVDLKTILAGLAINKDETATYGLVYDASSDTVRFGIGTLDENDNFAFNDGEGMPLAIRADSADFTDLHLVKWNATKKAFEDAGVSVADIQKDYTDKVNQVEADLNERVDQVKTDLQAEIVQTKNDIEGDIIEEKEDLRNQLKVDRMELVESVVGEYRDKGVGITVQGTGEITHANGDKDTFAGEIDIPLIADEVDITLENKDDKVVVKGGEYIEINDDDPLTDEEYARLTAKKGNVIFYNTEFYRFSTENDTELVYTSTSAVPNGDENLFVVYTLIIDKKTKRFVYDKKEIGEGGVDTIRKGTGKNAEAFNGIAQASAEGDYSHVEGEWSVAKGYASHAEGVASQALTHSSHAEGNHTIVPSGAVQGSHAEGMFNDPSVYTETFPAISTVGDGDGEDSRHNAFEVRKGGYVLAGNTSVWVNDRSLTTKKYVDKEITEAKTELQGKIDTKASTSALNSAKTELENEINTTETTLQEAIAKCTTDEELIETLKAYVKDTELAAILASYVKAGNGEQVVQRLTTTETLTLENSSMYIIQCYDSSGGTQDMTLTKNDNTTIDTDFTGVFTSADFQARPWNSLVIYTTGSAITGYIKATNKVVSVKPKASGNYLAYYKISGVTLGGTIDTSGTYVEANPSGDSQSTLKKIKIADMVYALPEGTTVYANPTTKGTTPLTDLTVGNATYTVPTITPNPDTDATDDLEKITIDGKTYFVGNGGGSSSGTISIYEHKIFVFGQLYGATDTSLTTPFYGLRLYFTIYDTVSTNYSSSDLYAKIFKYGSIRMVNGYFTSESDGMYDDNFKIAARAFRIKGNISPFFTMEYTAQNVTFDKSSQTVTAIDAAGEFNIGQASYASSEDFILHDPIVSDNVTIIASGISQADAAQTLELLNESETVNEPIEETPISKPDRTNDLAYQILMQRAEQWRKEKELAEAAVAEENTESTTNEESSTVTDESVDEYEVLVDGESIGTVSADDDDKGGAE